MYIAPSFFFFLNFPYLYSFLFSEHPYLYNLFVLAIIFSFLGTSFPVQYFCLSQLSSLHSIFPHNFYFPKLFRT